MKLLIILCAITALSVVQARTYFDKSKDILIAQFDSKPDTDDIHAQAALGCMLAHPDFSGVNYYGVAGAYGVQLDTYVFIDSTDLFNMAFGAENTKWTDAQSDWAGSVTRIKDEAKAVLNNGGAVWVQEAGQSDITADWVAALIADGVPAATIKSKVTVVQHSNWNQWNTDATDLAYVQAMTMYVKLDDGNQDPVTTNVYWTPNFTSEETSYLTDVKASANESFKAMWVEAEQLIDASSYNNPSIKVGGVDFSDTVETWWIFYDEANVMDLDAFWARYVVPDGDGGVTPSGDTYYNESGGLVVMEVENTPSNLGQWELKTTALENDYTGDGYLEFVGPNTYSVPAPAELEYTFKINTAGTYWIHLRGARETIDDRTDVANDCYIRVEGDYEAGPNAEYVEWSNAPLDVLQADNKFFVYAPNELEFTWSYGAKLEAAGMKLRALYTFKAGETYKLVVSGRSQYFRLDRIVFGKTSVAIADAEDTTLAESEVVGAASVEDTTYVALEDFPVTDAGAVPYYEDTANSCLAIDASVEANRTLFARASRTFGGVSGVYDIRITTLTEEDGESTYRLLVNGSVVATYTNPYIGPGSALDRKTNLHTWENISLQNSDTIAIDSNTDTNGEIAEGTGTAWSRGRWSQIELMNPDADPDSGPTLLAEWKFDDVSGSTATDSVGNYDGTLSGATWVADGVKGSALDMGGVGNVTIPAAAFSEINQAITISFWAYGATNQPVNDVAFRAGGAVNIHLPYGNSIIYWDAGYNGTTADRISKKASENEYKDQWNHWVFTKDAATGIMAIYLNGALWQSGTGKVEPMAGVTSASIGGVNNLYYHGMMDEVRLYDGALTSSAVQQLFESYETTGFTAWAASHGLDGDDTQSDSDSDGIINLMEYALGGDPTNHDAGGISPKHYSVEEDGATYFYFVHNERMDDPSLVYQVVSSSKLVPGTLWETNNIEVVEPSPVVNGIKTVTSRVEMASESMFLKLKVSQ
ncbi:MULTISPECIES: LamG domain-containing protein [unclassified Lentimonas]|uniref:LamG domain-containing protein n=1 Tax=unclassified Lentimonas TaxID=2630993 RepID=UPI00138A09AB|nr:MULTISPECIES: LamG domain-containing protein [unclassified Lentimonas]